MHLSPPLATCAVLIVVSGFDTRLYGFLAHAVTAMGCLMLLAVVSSRYVSRNAGYLRYLGFTLPWVALFELAIAFGEAHGGAARAHAPELHTAGFLATAGALAVAPLWIGRRVRVWQAVLPWAVVSAFLFVAILGSAPGAAGTYTLQLGDIGTAILFVFGIGGLVRRRAAFEATVFGLLLGGAVLALVASTAHAIDLHERAAPVIDMARMLSLWLFYVAAVRSLVAAPPETAVDYHGLFESAVVGVALTRADATYMTANPAYAKLFGYASPREMMETLPDAWALFADAESRKRIVEELSEGRAVHGAELALRRRDGSLVWTSCSVAAVRSRDGSVVGFQSVVLDITEARAAREEARHSNQRFEIVARATNDAVWDWDLQADTVWWNESYEALFGYENRVGKPSAESWSDHIHPEDRRAVVDGIQAALAASGASWAAEYRYLRRDGTYADVHDRGYIVRGADGRPVRMIGAMQDITQRKAMEGALRESERRFRDLVEISSDWYWEQDAELRFTMISGQDALVASGGRGVESVLGRQRWELPFNEPVNGDWAAHRAALERREPFRNFLLRGQAPDGGTRYLSISGEPLFDADGRFRGYRGTGSDVTAREQAEQERSRIARLYASLSALNELVARAGSEAELLQGACEIAVASGAFQFAVVRMITNGRASVAAVAGQRALGAFDRPLDLTPGSPDAGSLAAAVYRSGRSAIVSGAELSASPFLANVARETGARAAAGYPLFRDGACAAVLFLNSLDARGFEGEIGELLERMARNVSLGLDTLAASDALRRFRLAFDRSADLVGLVDRESMRFVDVNETLCGALGYSREELLAMSPDQVLPLSRAELEASYDLLIAEPSRSLPLRSHYIRRDGSHLPFEATRHAIRSAGRWVIVGVGRDIRERLAAEDALRRFRLALDQSGELIAIVDLETMRYVDVNDPLCRALGYTREELLQMHPDELIPYDRETLHATYTRLTRGEAVAAIRSHYKCKDGSHFPYESRRHAVFSEGRWLIVSIARDRRAELAAEETLRRREAYFRSLIENASDAIAATDMDWRYLYVSPAIEQLTGVPPEAIIGRRYLESTVSGSEAIRADLERRFAAGAGAQHVHFDSRRSDGILRRHESLVSKAAGPDGEPIYVIVSRDITDRIEAQEALRRREEELRAVAENAPDGIMRFDDGLRIVFANPAMVKTSGLPREGLVGRRLDALPIPSELKALFSGAVQRALQSGETQTIEFVFAGPRGERQYHARLAPERVEAGRPATVLSISRDVTDRKRAEQAMAESEARLRGIVEATAEPLLLVDRQGFTLFANPAAGALFGRPVAHLEGAPLGLPLADGRPADVDILLPEGGIRPAEMQFATTELGGSEVLVVSLHDLSERKQFEQHIQHLATHDGLTGLPNRAVLGDRIEQAILQAKRAEGTLALMFVDLDQFKLVNDSFGHLAGDALLMEVAGRLSAAVREGDTVARLGGDEFVVLLTNLTRPGDAAVVARKIAAALEAPIVLESGELRATASIGISVYPDDGESLEALLQSADAAMYRAKDRGRNGYQFYSAEMGEQARARVETEAGLRRAIEREEFQLHFQPQVSLATGELIGVEALLRWNHPQRGMVAPASFIPTAEETGLIVPIGEWALRAACREAAGWTAAGLGKVKVAVNLSARQFWRGSVTEAVRAALGESGLPASQLEVEITESVVARDLKQVMLALEQLRRMGVTVAIDDFGTGYSSLAYLRSLPIQKLKIDRSFVKGIPSDAEATALVGEIVRLAHVLSLSVVAEGVETPEQAAYLHGAGCEAMQGYLFARPMPAADLAALIRSGRKLEL